MEQTNGETLLFKEITRRTDMYQLLIKHIYWHNRQYKLNVTLVSFRATIVEVKKKQ
jgi:hypothetical protein